MDTDNNNNNNSIGGVVSYVGPCRDSPPSTSPVPMFSENSNPPSGASSSGSASEDGPPSAGGSPRGREEGGSVRPSRGTSVASLTKLNGMVLLCKVCGDAASGFHYGVHACEGCKGFFRRSIQQNIQYKKCVKNEKCTISRMNRNRCQHCRFKKCLSVSMSRDAVRFGRIPKREKQRLLAEMQRAMANMNNMVNNELQNDFQLASLSPSLSPTTTTVTSQPEDPPLPVPLAYQSPPRPPSPAPSPGLDSTITAIARAHRETFLYAHDKLTNHKAAHQKSTNQHAALPQNAQHTQNNHTHHLQQQQQQPNSCHFAQPNSCLNGYHENGPNTIFHHENNMDTGGPAVSQSQNVPHHNHHHHHHHHHHGSSRRRSLQHINLIGGDEGQNCPMKKRPKIVLACPMNSQTHSDPSRSQQAVWEDFSLSFSPAVKEVVEFSKHIPGFNSLTQNDQVTLLKAGTFEVLMVRFASLFNIVDQTVTFISGATYRLGELRAMGMSSLLTAMFDFSHKLAALQLDAQELGLFTAVVLVSADRFGIENVLSVERLQDNLIKALRSLVGRSSQVVPGNNKNAENKNNNNENNDNNHHSNNLDSHNPRFTKLLLKLPDLRTLNSLHSEKLLSFRMT